MFRGFSFGPFCPTTLVMLEAWEAATAYLLRGLPAGKPQPLEIAHLLGWTREGDGRKPRLKNVFQFEPQISFGEII